MCALNFFVLKLTHPRQVKMLQTHLTAARRRLDEAAFPAASSEESHLQTVLDFLSKLFPEQLREAAAKLAVRGTPSAAAAAAAAAAASAGPDRRPRSPSGFQRRVSPRRLHASPTGR